MVDNQLENDDRERLQEALYALARIINAQHPSDGGLLTNNDLPQLRVGGVRSRSVDEFNELRDARFLAQRFARRIRMIVNDLEVERNLLRQIYVNRNMVEPPLILRRFNFSGSSWKYGSTGSLRYSMCNWIRPGCLLNMALSVFINETSCYDLRSVMEKLPLELIYKINEKMYVKGMLTELSSIWCHNLVFSKMLMYKCKRIEMHRMFGEVSKQINGFLPARLLRVLNEKVSLVLLPRDKNIIELKQLYDYSLELGNFFLERLIYSWADNAFRLSKRLFHDLPENMKKKELNRLNYYLLLCYTDSCDFENAKKIASYFEEIFSTLRKCNFQINDDVDYGQMLIQNAILWQQMGHYKKSMVYVVDALKTVALRKTSLKTTMIIFRISAKILISVRQLNLGYRLMKHTLHTAYLNYDAYKQYPQVLLDYAFCLVNLDCIKQAVPVYTEGIKLLEEIFGPDSICLSQAYEEIAYALYVLEYSTGHFSRASQYAERALSLNTFFLPSDHMLVATSRRMKALILEEQALNESNASRKLQMLEEALNLHNSALLYYQKRFGDDNIFTAKNYGNIGRVYQSLQNYEKSEEMHLKAIEIKKKVVGEEDYETALSLSHLAALYTNDMGRHVEAKNLYLRSAEIVTKIFGDTFTGLQYDYRGLHRVYTELGDEELAQQYYAKLNDWYEKRRVKGDDCFVRIWSTISTMENACELASECLNELSLAGYS